MKYILVGLTTFGTKKPYYQAVVIDSEGNVSKIFIDEELSKNLRNLLYKDITTMIIYSYDRATSQYRLSIKK